MFALQDEASGIFYNILGFTIVGMQNVYPRVAIYSPISIYFESNGVPMALHSTRTC